MPSEAHVEWDMFHEYGTVYLDGGVIGYVNRIYQVRQSMSHRDPWLMPPVGSTDDPHSKRDQAAIDKLIKLLKEDMNS